MTEMPALLESVAGLQHAVEELSGRADTQQEVIDRIERNRRATRTNRILLSITILGLLLDLSLTVLGVFLFHRVDQNASSVREVQSRTSNQVLCPLYQTLITSFGQYPAQAGATPAQVQFRIQAAQVIKSGFNSLHC